MSSSLVRYVISRILAPDNDYYNGYRVHADLGGKNLLKIIEKPKLNCVNSGHYTWKDHCKGLFQMPVAA